MRKYIRIVIVILILIVSVNVTVYAGMDFSKVVNALQKLPYLYEFIQEFFMHDNVFSFILFRLVRVFAEIILGIIIIAIGKNFTEQGATILHKETKKVISSGALAYILLLMLLVLFFVSFIGFPIGVTILVVAYIFIVIGKVSFSSYIGYILELRFGQNWHTYLDYLVGVIVIEMFCFIPYLGQIILLLLVPIISIGILIITILNKFVYKTYYKTPFRQEINDKKYIQEDIRKIIMHNIDE